MRLSRARGLCAAAIAGTAAACIFSTDARVAQLRFNRLPGPSVVVGDTLRDSLGIASPLTAEITEGRTVTFIPLDTNIRVDANGFLTARSRDTASNASNIVRVIADGDGSLQTPPAPLTVTVRPDQLVQHGAVPVALLYDPAAAGTVADTANRSAPLQVRLRHAFVAGEAGAVARDTVVRAYRVRYEIVAVPAVADSAAIVDDNRILARFDTTDNSGIGSRRVRIYPKTSATTDDSVVVLARVWYRSVQIAGSPVRIVVPLRKR
jgi:hypothetical protein